MKKFFFLTFTILGVLIVLVFAGMYLLSNRDSDDRVVTVPATNTPVTTPTPANRSPANRFKILWAFNTQVEDMADLEVMTDTVKQTQLRAEIAQLKSRVDGYSMNVLKKGMFMYWPDRPYRCALNQKTNSDDPDDPISIKLENVTYQFAQLWDECDVLYKDYVKTLPSSNHEIVHRNAIDRVITNVGFAAEQALGKMVNAQTIVQKDLFSYNAMNDSITVGQLPGSVAVFNTRGIDLDTLFIYQEPSLSSRMLQVPGTPGGPIEYLPHNVRMVNMLDAAFTKKEYPIGQFLLNIRRLSSNLQNRIVTIKNSQNFGGLTFEGGTRLLDKPKGGVGLDERATAIAWALKNTNKNVYILMPAHWQCDDTGTCIETNTEETRAVMIERLRTVIRAFDTKIKAANGGESRICDRRVYLIPGAYGYPLHPKTFPIYTPSGQLASTLGGQIVALDDLRKSMCDTNTPPV